MGGYCCLEDTTKRGKESFLDINGNDARNYINSRGKKQGRNNAQFNAAFELGLNILVYIVFVRLWNAKAILYKKSQRNIKMNFIAVSLKKQYDHERKSLSDYSKWPKTINNVKLATNEDVLRGYYLLADYFINSDKEEKMCIGLKNLALLESAIGRQVASFGNLFKWKDVYQIAATLFYGLNKNHAFHDGNKRISLLMLIYVLYINGRWVNSSIKEFETLSVRVAANELSSYLNYKKFKKRHPDDTEILFIADFVKKKTRAVDKNYYALTYREFDTKLKDFGCRLDNPSGGFIDVVYYEIQKRIWPLKPRKIEKRFNIGFKSWQTQVGAKAVKEALKKCHLTAEYGIDSMVFYKNTEPINQLIQYFEGPLRRLKDR